MFSLKNIVQRDITSNKGLAGQNEVEFMLMLNVKRTSNFGEKLKLKFNILGTENFSQLEMELFQSWF